MKTQLRLVILIIWLVDDVYAVNDVKYSVNDDCDNGEEIYKNYSVINDEDGEKLPLSKKAPLKKQDWLGLARKIIINSQSPAST